MESDDKLDKFIPHDEIGEVLDEVAKMNAFRKTREETTRFKPMEIADCHIARSCGNCLYNKGRIDELNEFLDYGRAFYYGFYACTLKGRTPDMCMLTEVNNVCKSHKFASKGINPRKPSRALMHIADCIAEKAGRMSGRRYTYDSIESAKK